MSDLKEILQENSYMRQQQLIFADCDRYQRARVSTLLSIAAAVAGADYDAAIFDVMMPRMDGFSVLAQMRADGNETPVLFLTAKDSVPDRVHGLDTGADDYLVKPFSSR